MAAGGLVSLDLVTYPIRRGANIVLHGKVGNILPPTVRPLGKGIKFLAEKGGMKL